MIKLCIFVGKEVMHFSKLTHISMVAVSLENLKMPPGGFKSRRDFVIFTGFFKIVLHNFLYFM